MNAPQNPRARDLTQGPVAKTLVAFALPSLWVNILQSINGSVNAVWVGKLLGEEALAATSSSGMVMFLMFATLFGFAMATTIMIGQAIGRGDVLAVRRNLGAALGLFSAAGLLCAALGWLFTPHILRLLATPAEAYDLAVRYLRVIFLGMPFSFVMILLSSALRGIGDAITPMRNTMLNVALDVVLNPLLILGIGPLPALGVAGSALATLIAGLVSVAVLIRRIYAQDLAIRLRGAELGYLRPDAAHVRPILRLGFPMGLQMIIMSGSFLVLVGLVNREGVDTAAAFGVMNQLWNYVQMPAVSVGSAVSAMAAQNIGAGRWDRIGRIARAGIGVNVGMTALMVSVMLIFSWPLFALFLPAGSPAIATGVHINQIVTWTFIPMGVSMVLISIVRANGAVVVPLLMLVNSAVIVRLGFAFGLYPRIGADAVWWSFIAAGAVSLAQTIAYYHWGRWRGRNRLVAGEADQVAT